jgi:hypothetical protein
MFLRLFRWLPNRFFRSIYHYRKDLPITFTCSASNKMLNTFTTLGVPLKYGGRGGPKTQNASVHSEPMLLYAGSRGQISASGPGRPYSASAMTILALAPLQRAADAFGM